MKAHPGAEDNCLYRCSGGTLPHMFLGGASCHCHKAPRQGHTQFVWDHLVLKAKFAGMNTAGSMKV